MATEKVYEFLLKNNRPFNLNDVFQGLADPSIGKTNVLNCLNKLRDEQKIIEKTYGKQSIYCVVQEVKNIPNEALMAIDRESNCWSLKLDKIGEQLKSVGQELAKKDRTITVDEANEMKQKLVHEIDELEKKLESFKQKSITIEDINETLKEHEMVLKEYRTRKRLCNEIIDAIFENYPKSKKHLLQEIGIETDEEAGFKLEI